MAILNGDGIGHARIIQAVLAIVHGIVLQQAVALDTLTLNVQVFNHSITGIFQQRLAALGDGQRMAVTIQRCTEGVHLAAHVCTVHKRPYIVGILDPAYGFPIRRQGHICRHFEVNAFQGDTGVHLVPHGFKTRQTAEGVRVVLCAASGDARFLGPFTGFHGDGGAGILRDSGGDFCICIAHTGHTAIRGGTHFVGQRIVHAGGTVFGNCRPSGGSFRLAVPLVAQKAAAGRISVSYHGRFQLPGGMSHSIFFGTGVGHNDGRGIVNSPRHRVLYIDRKLLGPFRSIHGIGDEAFYLHHRELVLRLYRVAVRGGDLQTAHLPAVGGGAACRLHLLCLRFIQHHLQFGLIGGLDSVERPLSPVSRFCGVQPRGEIVLLADGIYDNIVASGLGLLSGVTDDQSIGLGADFRGIYRKAGSFFIFCAIDGSFKPLHCKEQVDIGSAPLDSTGPVGVLVHLSQRAALHVVPVHGGYGQMSRLLQIAVGYDVEFAVLLFPVFCPGQGHGIGPLEVVVRRCMYQIRLNTLNGFAVLGGIGFRTGVYGVANIAFSAGPLVFNAKITIGNIIQIEGIGVTLRGLHTQIPLLSQIINAVYRHIKNIFAVFFCQLNPAF